MQINDCLLFPIEAQYVNTLNRDHYLFPVLFLYTTGAETIMRDWVLANASRRAATAGCPLIWPTVVCFSDSVILFIFDWLLVMMLPS